VILRKSYWKVKTRTGSGDIETKVVGAHRFEIGKLGELLFWVKVKDKNKAEYIERVEHIIAPNAWVSITKVHRIPGSCPSEWSTCNCNIWKIVERYRQAY
jgi:hypothetical protein